MYNKSVNKIVNNVLKHLDEILKQIIHLDDNNAFIEMYKANNLLFADMFYNLGGSEEDNNQNELIIDMSKKEIEDDED